MTIVPVTATVTATVAVAAAGAWPVATVTAVAARRLAAGQVLTGRLTLDDLDRHQGQLAAVVDLADLDLDLVTDVDHVVDVLDPPAAVQLADLRDVQQAVLAGQQADERAEGRGLDHGAQEPLADLGHVRVGDGVDRGPGRLGRGAVGGADVDRAVVFDGDLGAGVVLDRVDHLALGPDDLADLVHRDLDRDDPRRVRGHLAGLADRAAHDLENGHPGRAGLLERRGQHRGRDAVELGVQLQRGDHLLGARDLEVHVAERVLGAEDVGQRHVLAALVDQAHGDAGHHVLERHARVEQRHRGGADRAHGRGAVRADRLRHLPDRVRELLAGGQHREQRPLGQRAVPDLAALRRADPAGLTGGVRREVVVVHVALGPLGVERVDHLLHAEHVQRGETQILGVTTLNMLRMEQMIDTLNPERTKRYMHNYNFPPYSTGETGRVGSPKRREIGHGALAERALLPVLPAREEFPYAIRQVSEAISSNGSTSMGSVCASTMSLLDAGVPLKDMV